MRCATILGLSIYLSEQVQGLKTISSIVLFLKCMIRSLSVPGLVQNATGCSPPQFLGWLAPLGPGCDSAIDQPVAWLCMTCNVGEGAGVKEAHCAYAQAQCWCLACGFRSCLQAVYLESIAASLNLSLPSPSLKAYLPPVKYAPFGKGRWDKQDGHP